MHKQVHTFFMKFKFILLIFFLAFVNLGNAQSILTPPYSATIGDRVTFKIDSRFASPSDKIEATFYTSGKNASFNAIAATYVSNNQVYVLLPDTLIGNTIYSVYIKNRSTSSHNVTTPPIKVLVRGGSPSSSSVVVKTTSVAPVVSEKKPNELENTNKPKTTLVEKDATAPAVKSEVVTPKPATSEIKAVAVVEPALQPKENKVEKVAEPQVKKSEVIAAKFTETTKEAAAPQTTAEIKPRVSEATSPSTVSTPVATKPELTPIALIHEPESISVVSGNAATFQITVSGTSPHYQWLFNTHPIAGANASSYTISAATDANAGFYTCTVSNSLGSKTTSPFTLTVTAAVIITAQPESSVSVKAGSSTTLSVAASGQALHYQWYLGSSAIKAATNASYTITSATPDAQGSYTCYISNDAGNTTSSAAVVTVIPAEQTVTFAELPKLKVGTASTLSALATSNGPITYTLVSGNAKLVDSTLTALDTNPIVIEATQAGNSSFVSATAKATLQASAAEQTVTFTELPKLKVGTAATLSALATSNGPITYTLVSGNAKLVEATLTALDTKPIVVEATQAGNSSFVSATAKATLQASAAEQTVSFAELPKLKVGTASTLSASATSNGPITYTLVSGNAKLVDSTLTALDTKPIVVKATQSGSSSFASATAEATLEASPAEQTVTFAALPKLKVGTASTLSASATSNGPITYTLVSGNAKLVEATLTALDTKPIVVEATQSGSSSFASASAKATLEASAAEQTVTFAELPKLKVGTASTLSASATSNGPITYTLVSGNAKLVDSTLTALDTKPIVVEASQSGTTSFASASTKATLEASPADQTITFAEIPKLKVGTASTLSASATSNGPITYTLVSGNAKLVDATLTALDTKPIVVKATQSGSSSFASATAEATLEASPADQTVTFAEISELKVGIPTALSATATSKGPITYTLVSGNAKLVDSTLTALDTKPIVIEASQSGLSNYSAASSTLKLTASLNAIAITHQPQSVSIVSGGSANFEVSATGTSPTYQWLYNDSPISGATSSSFSLSTATSANAGSYSCKVSNDAGSKTSSIAKLTVTPAVIITAQPTAATTIKVGSPVTLSVTATGNNLSYQWYVGSKAISEATASSFTIASASTSNEGSYTCLVSNNAGKAISSAAIVSVQPVQQTLTFDTLPQLKVGVPGTLSATATSKGEIRFSVVSGNATLSGSALTALDTKPIVIQATQPGSSDYLEGSTTTTIKASLEPIILTHQPESLTVVGGDAASFDVTATGTSPTYQWLYNDSPISGATSSSYSLSTATSANAGNYSCKVSNGENFVVSNQATLTVSPAVIITAQPTSALTVKVGSSPTLSVTAKGKALSYQWYLGSKMIDGATQSTYTIASASYESEGTYTCYVSNSGGNATTTPTLINVIPARQSVTFDSIPKLKVGKPVTLSATATSNGPITYSVVSGNAKLVDSTLTAFDTKPIIVQATQAGSANFLVASTTATISASLEAIVLTQQPQSLTIVSGSPANFEVAALGTAPKYQWYFNDSVIAEATSPTFTLSTATAADAGNYTCKVSNDSGSQISSTAKLTITPAKQTITFDAISEFKVNIPATLSAVATSKGAVTYTLISGNAKLVDGTLTPLDTKPIIVEAKQSGSSNFAAESTRTTLYASLDPIEFIRQPESVTVVCGRSATFEAIAKGTAPSYQWYFNDSAIPTATVSSFTLNSVTTANAGTYTCKVSNSAGTKTSTAVTLSVTPAAQTVSFDTLPELKVGVPATISATATGNGPVTYSVVSGNATLVGSTLTALDTKRIVIQATQSGSGNYSPASTTTNLTASLDSINLTQQPESIKVVSGNPANFEVIAKGTSPTYQWLFNGKPISGAVSPSYTLTSASAENAGNYSCIVSNAISSKTSAAATLTINPAQQTITFDALPQLKVGVPSQVTATATSKSTVTYSLVTGNATLVDSTLTALDTKPIVIQAIQAGSSNYLPATATTALTAAFEAITFTHQPDAQTVVSGNSASFEVTATGTSPSYQWLFNDKPIESATSASYTLTAVTADNAGIYTCMVSNSMGSKTTAPAVLTVTPANQTVTFDHLPKFKVDVPASLSAIASSNGPITYALVSGNATLTESTLTILDTKPIVIKATQAGSSNFAPSSTTKTITAVLEAITLTHQPDTLKIVSGNPATFEVTATGTAPTYQWYFNENPIASANTSTYTINSVTSANQGAYKCTVSNSISSKTSDVAALTVTPAVVITTQPIAAVTVKVGTATTLSLAATGKELTYQWFLGSTPIESATNASYTIAFATSANEGSYTCVVSNAAGNVTSTPAVVTVLSPPIITLPPASQAVSLNTTTRFTIKATGTNLIYQWYFNDTAIIGATTDAYTIGAVAPADIGNYTCSVTNAVGSTMSAVAKLSLNSTHIQNLTIRSVVGSSNLVVGFGSAGTGPKSLAIRCNVPSVIRTLSGGSGGAIPNPTLSLYANPGITAESMIALSEEAALSNDIKQVGSFPLTASSSNTIPTQNFLPGTYSAVLGGATNTSESAMLEIYDSDNANSTSRINRFSALGLVSIGSPVISCGFVVIGDATETLLIRAVGPSLSTFGLTGVLAQPSLTVYDSSINPIASNTVWDGGHKLSSAMTQVGAFTIPADSADSAVIVKVPAGAYTVQVSGLNGSIGNVMLEVYELNSP